MRKHLRSIEVFTNAAGVEQYRVRVRSRGRVFNGRFDNVSDAIRFRDEAVGAARGLNAPPMTRIPATKTPVTAVTVEDCARRLARGMRDGSLRSRDGTPYKPSVMRKYEENLRVFVLTELGAVPISTLTTGDLQRFVDGLAAARTPEHARKALTALRVALRVAIRYGELETNPCAGVRVPTSADGERPVRIVTPEEAAGIIGQAEKNDAELQRSFGGPLIALAFCSGLRMGELLALRWGSEGLDLDLGVVHVRRSLDRVRGDDGRYAEIAPKSRASRRTVPLPPEDIAPLRRHRLASGRPEDGELVFCGPHGEALSPVPATRAFRRAAQRVGIAAPLPRFHDTRHAFASHALAAGLTPRAVAALLGHSDAGLVLRRYGHALRDELAAAGEVLSAWRAARS